MNKVVELTSYKKCSKCSFKGRIHACSTCVDKSNFKKEDLVLHKMR